MYRQVNPVPYVSNMGCSRCRSETGCQMGQLKDAEATLLNNGMRHRAFLKNHQHVYQQGAPLECVYYVQSGLVKSYLSDSSGSQHIIGFHFPGDLLGIDAMQGRIHTSSAVTIQDACLCKFSWSDFDRLINACEHFRRQFLQSICGEVVQLHNLLPTLSQKKADHKLAYFLLAISRKMKSQGFSEHKFNLGMTRDDIANFLGTASETISRVFSELKKRGVIDVQRKYVVIRDLPALTELAANKLD